MTEDSQTTQTHAASDTGDLWDWLDAEEASPGVELPDPTRVTAVMVVHNARPWLARQLLSLARLDPRPGRIIAVDNASTDESADLLAREADEGVIDAVVTLTENNGFGAAVAAALGEDEPSWIWLLHDDSAPFPHTLASLLEGAGQHHAAIVVPKLLQPRRRNYPETLAEAGQSITRGGARVSFVEAGDVDQKQVESTPVLGGSTAGMLVRGDVWRELGGLAPELPVHRDGVDLGWRAGEAGHVVTMWPNAALTHRQSGRTGERMSVPSIHPHESDRLAALRVAAARGGKPAGRAGLLMSSALRAGGFLLGKSAALAAAEMRAARTFAATPEVTAALAARSVRPGNDVGPLLPHRLWSLQRSADRTAASVTERYRDLVETDTDTSLDEMTGDDFAGAHRTGRKFSPVLALLLLLTVLGLVAGRTLFGAQGVAGGGMLPAPASLGDAWEAYLRPTVGVDGGNAPWLLVAAFFSTFALGMPGWFALAALLLLPVIAGTAALLLLRRLGFQPGVAAAGAGVWAGAVVLLGIVGAGDLSGMSLAVTLPMLARSVHKMLHDEATGAERLRSPAAVGLWLILVAAAWPVVLPLLSVAGIAWVLLNRSRWVDVAIGLGLPWLFMAPWTPTLVRWPARLLMGADPLAWPDFPPAGFALLAGRIVPSGIPPWINVVFFGSLFVLAVLGLLRVSSTRDRVLMVISLAIPLVAGVLSSRVALETNGGEARALLSGWALLLVAALLVPALLALRPSDEGREKMSRTSRSHISILVLLGLLATGAWAWIGFEGPVGRSESQLPNYITAVMASERDARVLMLQESPQGDLAWNVVDARQPQWGTGEHEIAGAFAEEAGRIVASLGAAVVPEDLAAQLSSMGFSHLYMAGFSEDELAGVGNAAGLTRAAVRDGDVAWTVAGTPSRIRIMEARTSAPLADGQVAQSDKLRYVVIAEDADQRWWVSVGGVDLEQSPDRSPVSFTLPPGVSGALEWGMHGSWGALGWQVAVILLALGLLAPTLSSTSTARRVRQ